VEGSHIVRMDDDFRDLSFYGVRTNKVLWLVVGNTPSNTLGQDIC